MKKTDLQSPDGMINLLSQFRLILRLSGQDLNRLVQGNTLAIPSDMSKAFSDTIREFVEMVPDVVRNAEDKGAVWNSLEELAAKGENGEFIKWLKKYTEAVLKPFEEAMFLSEMDDRAFQEITDYCFENLVLQNTSRKRMDESRWDVKQLLILRKIFFTFIDMVISEQLSEERVCQNMGRMFGMGETRCNMWWNLILQNEEKIWRITMMKKISRIEETLDYLLEQMEE